MLKLKAFFILSITMTSLAAMASSDARQCTNTAGVVAEAFAATKGVHKLETSDFETVSTGAQDQWELGYQYSIGWVYVPVSTAGNYCVVNGAAHF